MAEPEVMRLSRREAIETAEWSLHQLANGGGYRTYPTIYRPALAELLIAAKQWDEHSAKLTQDKRHD